MQTLPRYVKTNKILAIVLYIVCHFNVNAAFVDDLTLLQEHYSPILLEKDNTKAIVLAELQGRVMVSTFGGENAQSLGWINREYLKSPHTNQNAAIGGASRLLFGPETGPYSFFFEPDKEPIAENIQVPAAFSTLPFKLVSKTDSQVNFEKRVSIRNHHGYEFILKIARSIELYSRKQIGKKLNVDIDPQVKQVGFGAYTSIQNLGEKQWSLESGIPSIWELGAFDPSDQTTVIIPIKDNISSMKQYFSENKASHLRISDGYVYYKADATYMNKIGIPPANTLPIFGSYDGVKNILTIVQFEFHQDEKYYNNSTWNQPNYLPYDGDVINIFNDGEVDGEPIFGPFYELETSSSARVLNVGQHHQHFQNIFHFSGTKQQLNVILMKLLGVELEAVEQVFNGRSN